MKENSQVCSKYASGLPGHPEAAHDEGLCPEAEVWYTNPPSLPAQNHNWRLPLLSDSEEDDVPLSTVPVVSLLVSWSIGGVVLSSVLAFLAGSSVSPGPASEGAEACSYLIRDGEIFSNVLHVQAKRSGAAPIRSRLFSRSNCNPKDS